MLSKIKRRLGLPIEEDTQDLLIMDLIEQAESFICLYLNIAAIEDIRLNSIVQSLAIDLFNRIGEEGKKTSIYSDYRSDFHEDMLTPYLGTLDAIKMQMQAENENLIRFF